VPPEARRADPWARHGANAGRYAKKAWYLAKYLKGLINVEKHKYDVDTGVVNPLGETVTTTPLTNIAIGDTDGTRTGNTLMTKYIYLKGRHILNSQGQASARVRDVIVRDKQQVGDTAPGFLDVYTSTGTISFLNKQTVGRFDILYDKLSVLSSDKPMAVLDKYIPLGNNHVRYNGTGATDVQKGGLYHFMVSDQAATGPSSSVGFRVGYIDN